MRRRPSPSLVISIIALVFAAAGTSIAAVNFARNAGAVDHKSAVGASSSQHRAAGKLVATDSGGKLPTRFLHLPPVGPFVSGGESEFSYGTEVIDNTSGTPLALPGAIGIGTLSATCKDQNTKAGTEDPAATVTFANQSGQVVNLARSVSNGNPTIVPVSAGTQHSFTMNASNTFRIYLQLGSTNYDLEGVFRQDGATTKSAVCQVYGYALTL